MEKFYVLLIYIKMDSPQCLPHSDFPKLPLLNSVAQWQNMTELERVLTKPALEGCPTTKSQRIRSGEYVSHAV